MINVELQIKKNKIDAELETEEQELDIDLVKLFTALSEGVVRTYKFSNKNYFIDVEAEYLSIGKKGLVVAYDDEFDDRILYDLPYEDYGKTWALTIEEVE